MFAAPSSTMHFVVEKIGYSLLSFSQVTGITAFRDCLFLAVTHRKLQENRFQSLIRDVGVADNRVRHRMGARDWVVSRGHEELHLVVQVGPRQGENRDRVVEMVGLVGRDLHYGGNKADLGVVGLFYYGGEISGALEVDLLEGDSSVIEYFVLFWLVRIQGHDEEHAARVGQRVVVDLVHYHVDEAVGKFVF